MYVELRVFRTKGTKIWPHKKICLVFFQSKTVLSGFMLFKRQFHSQEAEL